MSWSSQSKGLTPELEDTNPPVLQTEPRLRSGPILYRSAVRRGSTCYGDWTSRHAAVTVSRYRDDPEEHTGAEQQNNDQRSDDPASPGAPLLLITHYA